MNIQEKLLQRLLIKECVLVLSKNVSNYLNSCVTITRFVLSVAKINDPAEQNFSVLYIKVPFGLSLEEQEQIKTSLETILAGKTCVLCEQYPEDLKMEILWESTQG